MTSEPSLDRQEARRLLIAERDRLRSVRDGLQVGESESESLSELSDADQHPADTGTETFERERDLGILDAVEGELDDVEHALRRLDDGSYGTCEACGRPIGAERLAALPATRLCVEHATSVPPGMIPGASPTPSAGGAESDGSGARPI